MPQGEEKDVNTTESSVVEQDNQVENPEPGQEQEQQETENTESPSPSPRPGTAAVEEDENDDRGVPWKNRALENQRKLSELSESIPKLVEQALAEKMGKEQTTEPKYTFSQLEALALEKPEYRPWVEEQKEKLREERAQQKLAEAISKTEKAKEADMKRQKALGYVIESYPEVFVKDKTGRALDWDNNHPMSTEIARIMKDPRFAGDPDGLTAAADIAYAKFSRGQLGKYEKQVKQMTQKLKKAETQTLVEGSGKTPATKTTDDVRKAIDRLSQTGSKADAQAAIKAYLRKSGRTD